MENPEVRIEVEKKPEHRNIVKQSVQQQWKILSYRVAWDLEMNIIEPLSRTIILDLTPSP